MKRFARHYLILSILLIANVAAFSQSILTRAENSNFTETSCYEDVIEFLRQLQKQSSDINVTSIGQSTEGKEIFLAILGHPVPASPTQLFVMNKPAIYIQANIHAGEVEGKEAMLMLMREILTGKLHYLLDNQIFLIIPNFNPDGNEKISEQNRRNQIGPEGGVGVRYNGQFLDLNRDYIKLESQENLAAIQQILNKWDPMLLIDLHTTNGSYHQEPLTYATAHNPNGDPLLPNYIRKKLFPQVAKQLESEYDIISIPYGFFADRSDPAKGWGTFNHQPYYSTNYWGLRNRFAILNENYAYADFETRIRACYHFVELILHFTHHHYTEMRDLIRQVDLRTIQRGLNEDTTARFATEVKPFPFDEPLLIRSYEFETYQDERGRNRIRKTDQLKIYSIPFIADFKTTKSVRLPKGYLFSSNLKEIAQKLIHHGIKVEQLCKRVKLTVQVFKITKIDGDTRIYQGHKWTNIKGIYEAVELEFTENTYFIGMDQPLANLAAYLLEPESDGGLVMWNFFDRYIYASQWSGTLGQYPVYKLMSPVTIAKTIELN